MMDIDEGEVHPTKMHPYDQGGFTAAWMLNLLVQYTILYGMLATSVIKTFTAYASYKGPGWPEGAMWMPCIGATMFLIDRFKKCNRL